MEAALGQQPLLPLSERGPNELLEVRWVEGLGDLERKSGYELVLVSTYLAKPCPAPLLGDHLLLRRLQVSLTAAVLDKPDQVHHSEMLDAGDPAGVDVSGLERLAGTVPEAGHPGHIYVGACGEMIADFEGEEVVTFLRRAKDGLELLALDLDVVALGFHAYMRKENVDKRDKKKGQVTFVVLV